MLGTPCSEVVWRVLATHSIRQFPLQFPSIASPCAITFQLESTKLHAVSAAKTFKNHIAAKLVEKRFEPGPFNYDSIFFCSMYVLCTLTEFFLNLTEVFLTLTEVFPCFFLSCKANARGKTHKDGARPALFHISLYLCCSVVICIVLCIVCV